jgi:PAS domain-containing protein
MPEGPVDVVRIATPGDVVCAASQLLGFIPSDSVVALCCQGPNRRLGLAIRLDLAPEAPPADLAARIDAHVRRALADEVFVIVFGADPPNEALPFGDVVDEMQARSSDLIVEMLYVAGERCWSYLCDDRACCPAEGGVVDRSSRSATALAAAYALAGQQVLPNRDALVESVSFAGDATAAATMQTLVGRALHRHAEQSQPARRAAVRALLSRLSADADDPRRGLRDEDAAELAALCADVVVRDEILVRALEAPRRTTLRRILTEAARRLPTPVDAAICATLAFIAYADGDGVTANVLLDRTLGSDPAYSLGLLIADALHRQLPPRLFEDVMRGAAGDLKKAAPTR